MSLNATWMITSALALAAPILTAGCGQTACFEWSEDEGACPSQADAIGFFSDPDCPGTILSVESEGAFANNLCCYSVTKDSTSITRENRVCQSTGGTGGSTGGSTGGGDGGVSCLTCSDGLTSGEPHPPGLCAASQTPSDAVWDCLCSGPCMSACGDSLCAGASLAPDACVACLTNMSMAGCGTAFNACVAAK